MAAKIIMCYLLVSPSSRQCRPIFKEKEVIFVPFDSSRLTVQIIPLPQLAPMASSMIFWESGSWWRHQRRHFGKKENFSFAFDVTWQALQIIPLHKRARMAPSMTFWKPGSWWRHQRRHFWKKRKFLFRCNLASSTNHSITPTISDASFYDFLKTRKLMTSPASPFFLKSIFFFCFRCNWVCCTNYSITPLRSDSSFYDFLITRKCDDVIFPEVRGISKIRAEKSFVFSLWTTYPKIIGIR